MPVTPALHELIRLATAATRETAEMRGVDFRIDQKRR